MARRDNYRTLLEDELRNRQAARGQFTLATFAKYLGLTRSHLNDILKKRRGLSEAKARYIGKRLLLSPYEEDLFVSSVVAEHGRSRSRREKAREHVEALKASQVSILKDELFRLVAEWQHFAILELLRLPDFKWEARFIAKKLGLEVGVARASMDRLVKAELVHEVDGVWRSHKGLLMTTPDFPSYAVKSFHVQMSGLARKALYDQHVDRREFVSMILAIDRKNVPKAKERLRKFRDEMSSLLTREAERDALYALNMQFFELTDPET